jgi:hypothetical protein
MIDISEKSVVLCHRISKVSDSKPLPLNAVFSAAGMLKRAYASIAIRD